jgi:hypothetical protein
MWTGPSPDACCQHVDYVRCSVRPNDPGQDNLIDSTIYSFPKLQIVQCVRCHDRAEGACQLFPFRSFSLNFPYSTRRNLCQIQRAHRRNRDSPNTSSFLSHGLEYRLALLEQCAHVVPRPIRSPSKNNIVHDIALLFHEVAGESLAPVIL